jgi:hypothetical protein
MAAGVADFVVSVLEALEHGGGVGCFAQGDLRDPIRIVV